MPVLVLVTLLISSSTGRADGLGTFDDIGTPTGSNSGSGTATQPNPWADRSIASATAAQDCSPKSYLAQRPDVAAAGMDPIAHYYSYGKTEGMCHPAECTDAEYLRQRPDVAAANMTPETHYYLYGYNEGMCDPNAWASPAPGSAPTSDYKTLIVENWVTTPNAWSNWTVVAAGGGEHAALAANPAYTLANSIPLLANPSDSRVTLSRCYNGYVNTISTNGCTISGDPLVGVLGYLERFPTASATMPVYSCERQQGYTGTTLVRSGDECAAHVGNYVGFVVLGYTVPY